MSLVETLFSFSGRVSRKQYITFFVTLFFISFIFYMIFSEKTADVLLTILFLCPSVAMQIKRLHDINKSGWYSLLTIIPIVNIIMLVILLIRNGDPSSNKFGDPVSV
ncbi:MAG: DUF805 domain-containing protein [Candidatus Sericytochromatia bacterium]